MRPAPLLERLARESGAPAVYRVNGPDELPDDLSGTVGVTAGASAPEQVVQAVIDHLAPTGGVEEVRITDEDEYFPPPRELRELLPALDAIAAFTLGGDPQRARALGGPFVDDRTLDASHVLAALSHDV